MTCFLALVFHLLRLLHGLHKPDWIKAVAPISGCTSESLQGPDAIQDLSMRISWDGAQRSALSIKLPGTCRPAFGHKWLKLSVEKISEPRSCEESCISSNPSISCKHTIKISFSEVCLLRGQGRERAYPPQSYFVSVILQR